MRTPTGGSSPPTGDFEEAPRGILSSDALPSRRSRRIRRGLSGLIALLLVGTSVFVWGRQQNAVATNRSALIAANTAKDALTHQVADLEANISELQSKAEGWRSSAKHSQQRSKAMKVRLADQHAAMRDVTQKLAHVSGPKLDDGRYLVNVAGITMAGEPLLTFDLLTVYSGQKAVDMAKDQGGWVGPEGLYIVNDDARLRTMEVRLDAEVRITFWYRNTLETGKAISLATFADVMSGREWWQHANKAVSYWITVTGGSIDSIVARYVEPAC